MTNGTLELKVKLAADSIKSDVAQFNSRLQQSLGDTKVNIDVEVDPSRLDRLNRALEEVQQETSQAAADAIYLQKQFDLDDGEIDKVVRKMRQLEDATEDAGDEVGGLSGLLQGFAGGAAFAVIDKLVDVLGSGVEAAREFVGSTIELGKQAEQSKVAFETILGGAEAAEKTLGDLTDFAANTPFEFTGVREAGQALLAFNFQANELTPTLTRIGDVASGVGTDFNELSVIYGKARVQGRLFAEDVNQLTERGIPIIQEFAKQFGVSETQVKKLVEQGKIGFPELEQAFIDMTSEGGQFFGLMEAQSQTFGGKLSNLNDGIDQFKIKLFQAFEPALSGGLQTFSDILDEAGQRSDGLDGIADAAERLKAELQGNPELAEKLGAALATVFDEGVDQIEGVIDAITDLLSNEDAVDAYADRIEGVADAIKALGQVVRFLIALASGFSSVQKSAEEIPVIGGAIARAMQGPIPVLGTLRDLIQGVINLLGGAVNAANNLKAALQGVGDAQSQIAANAAQSDIASGLEQSSEALQEFQKQIQEDPPPPPPPEPPEPPDPKEVEKAALEGLKEANAKAEAAIEQSQNRRVAAVKQAQLANTLTVEEAATKIAAIEQSAINETIAAREDELARVRGLRDTGQISAEEAASRERDLITELGQLNLDRIDAEIAAQEEAKKLAIAAIEEEFDARKQATENQDSLLSAQAGLQSALATLEQEKLKTQIEAAEAAGDEAGAKALQEQLTQAQVAAEQKAFEFKAKALEIEIQLNRLELERELAIARRNGASQEEIANLQEQLALVDEIGDLQRQQLDAEKGVAAERRQQEQIKADAAEEEAAQKQQEEAAAAAQKEAEAQQREQTAAEPTSPEQPPDDDRGGGFRAPIYVLNGREVSVNEYLGGASPTRDLDQIAANPQVQDLAASVAAGQPNASQEKALGLSLQPILDRIDVLQAALVGKLSRPNITAITPNAVGDAAALAADAARNAERGINP